MDVGERIVVHRLFEIDRIEGADVISRSNQQLAGLDDQGALGSSTFTLFFFRKFEIVLYDVGSQREFERISFKTLSFMVAFPFSAKRKMTL